VEAKLKDIRGAEALKYAETNGLNYSIDERFLIRAESSMRGKPVSMNAIESLIEEEVGEPYDSTNIFPESSTFKFLLNRYGEGWIYVALEGNHPEEEEAAVLRLFRQLLNAKEPSNGGDILDLATQNPPRLRDTGFPKDADADLLFHAARRLVNLGVLESIPDPEPLPRDAEPNYGNTYFLIPTDFQLSLAGLLCQHCVTRLRATSLELHAECARRLKTALAGQLTASESSGRRRVAEKRLSSSRSAQKRLE
jgi:hypothetical protein